MNIWKHLFLSLVSLIVLSSNAKQSTHHSYNLVYALHYCIIHSHEHIQQIDYYNDQSSMLFDNQKVHYAHHLSLLYDMLYALRLKNTWSMQDQGAFEAIIKSLTRSVHVDDYKRVLTLFNTQQIESYKHKIPYIDRIKQWLPTTIRTSLAVGCLYTLYYHRSTISSTACGLKNFCFDFVQALKDIHTLYQRPAFPIDTDFDLFAMLPAEAQVEPHLQQVYQKSLTDVELYNNSLLGGVLSPQLSDNQIAYINQESALHAKRLTLPDLIQKAQLDIRVFHAITPSAMPASQIMNALKQYYAANTLKVVFSLYNFFGYYDPYIRRSIPVFKAFAYLSTIPLATSMYKSYIAFRQPKKLPHIRTLVCRLQRILIEIGDENNASFSQRGLLHHYVWCIAQQSRKYLSKANYQKFMRDVYSMHDSSYSLKQKRSLIENILSSYEFLSI